MTVHFNYIELLKRSEWKKKRDEIIKRDRVCQSCNSSYRLEVHHIFYFANIAPWEYPDDMLILLCRGCHSIETKQSKILDNLIKFMKYKGLLSVEIIDKLMAHIPDADFNDFHNSVESIKKNQRNRK